MASTLDTYLDGTRLGCAEPDGDLNLGVGHGMTSSGHALPLAMMRGDAPTDSEMLGRLEDRRPRSTAHHERLNLGWSHLPGDLRWCSALRLRRLHWHDRHHCPEAFSLVTESRPTCPHLHPLSVSQRFPCSGATFHGHLPTQARVDVRTPV